VYAGPDDLLQLAAAAALEQQQDQAAGFRDQNMQQYDPSTLAAMQQYDPSWAAAYAGMPMGMMNMNYYWPTGCMPGQYPQQKHPSLTKPEHQSRFLSLQPVGNMVVLDCGIVQQEQHCSCRPQVQELKKKAADASITASWLAIHPHHRRAYAYDVCPVAACACNPCVVLLLLQAQLPSAGAPWMRCGSCSAS
jgi:hypothetical protein